jgi:hypothetical protein
MYPGLEIQGYASDIRCHYLTPRSRVTAALERADLLNDIDRAVRRASPAYRLWLFLADQFGAPHTPLGLEFAGWHTWRRRFPSLEDVATTYASHEIEEGRIRVFGAAMLLSGVSHELASQVWNNSLGTFCLVPEHHAAIVEQAVMHHWAESDLPAPLELVSTLCGGAEALVLLPATLFDDPDRSMFMLGRQDVLARL